MRDISKFDDSIRYTTLDFSLGMPYIIPGTSYLV